jgi:predicted component of type VI protein secretion system
MKAELVPDNGDPPIPITRDVTVVGRREFCDVQVNDVSLSKRHCVLVKTDGLLVIRDLGTTNGTKVKGQRIRWAALLPDDRITLGNYKMRVYLGPDNAPGPSELAKYRTNGPDPKTAGARPKGKASAVPAATSARAAQDKERAEAGASTPVEPPVLATAVGEDDLNWQGLRLLDEDNADVMIELD